MSNCEDEPSEEILIDASEMEDSVTAECPECGLSGEVPDSWVGLVTECKECGGRFTVKAGEGDE